MFQDFDSAGGRVPEADDSVGSGHVEVTRGIEEGADVRNNDAEKVAKEVTDDLHLGYKEGWYRNFDHMPGMKSVAPDGIKPWNDGFDLYEIPIMALTDGQEYPEPICRFYSAKDFLGAEEGELTSVAQSFSVDKSGEHPVVQMDISIQRPLGNAKTNGNVKTYSLRLLMEKDTKGELTRISSLFQDFVDDVVRKYSDEGDELIAGK